MKKIESIAELATMLNNAKCGGQFVSLRYRKPITLKKGGRCGLPKIAPDFAPYKECELVFHFAEDYDARVQRLLNKGAIDNAPTFDESKRMNAEHLVHNVLMRYRSTQNTCVIAISENVKRIATTFVDGTPLTEEELSYMAEYLPTKKTNAIGYYTIGVNHLTKMVVGGETYEISITE